ncbi:DUF4382 domain-containing protein [Winogradskyella thalassocola]|uniref:Carboxypeptidase regulatory-like domain-containing protein n=1 Tax=Winogradskyella thalassocola TaxID=262004 RepID=A0A1G7XKP8_9FLAO|nr:DUF4382 domain-containing protein [Winogradskyella thalassocola]SDG84200.1 Carboxypeptidase regulatory-like domain-containing protein [Winogradskyella thalassocola]
MKLLKQITSILILLLAFSCSDSDSSDNLGTAKMSVKLVDDPGDYENVFVEIIDVMVKYQDDADGDDDGGWNSIGVINPGVYDLLELTGGVSLSLVDDVDIQTGTIQQIRLLLGDDNSVVLEGETEPRLLNTPSAQQSGLKVMVNQPILSGFNYDFILDFDVDESIVMAGNSDNINLKPVLRASLEVNSGTLVGEITNSDIAAEVFVDNGQGVTASTMVNSSGYFEIPGLPAGVYTVTVTPNSNTLPLYQIVIIDNVEITVGSINTLDPITLI